MFLDTSSIIINTFSDKMINSTTPITNIFAKNGNFQMRKTPLMTSIIEEEDIFEDLPEVEPSITLNIPKIPFHVFELISSFFRIIYMKDKTESTIMVFYNKEEDSFILWVPIQTNAAASSNYKREDDPNYTRMCKENMLVMVAHSHPWAATKGPSPSGIDNSDEKESLIYMILGNVQKTPTYTISTCPNGKRTFLEFQDVFELPEDTLTKEEKINILVEDKKVVLNPVMNVFFKFATEEEFDTFFQENVDNDLVSKIISTSYKDCEDEIPKDWISQCTSTAVVKAVNPVTNGYTKNYANSYNGGYANSYNYNDAYYQLSQEYYNQKLDSPRTMSAKQHHNLKNSFLDGGLTEQDDVLYEQYLNDFREKSELYEDFYEKHI